MLLQETEFYLQLERLIKVAIFLDQLTDFNNVKISLQCLEFWVGLKLAPKLYSLPLKIGKIVGFLNTK